MDQKLRARIVRWMLVILCMAAIFCFSSQNGEQSTGTSDFIINIIQRYRIGRWILQGINIRKLAHFSIYFVLGILVFRALLLYAYGMIRRGGFSLTICLIYACTDEFHQIFMEGRTASVIDIGIDTAGALLGIVLAICCYRYIFKN